MPVWVSLLRGVNLGARNKVNMPRLREALTAAGFTDVHTYVQSGNVVAGSEHADPAFVVEAVRAVVAEHFDVEVPVVVRSPEQLRDIAAWCPFPEDAGTRPTQVHVIHLAANPDPVRVAQLCAEDWAPDGLAVRGQEVVIRYAETMHTSRLQQAKVLKCLCVDGTARNWRTLTALVDRTAAR
ncbi:MAG: DUF1697 domain-containing protein [Actinomycetota bacterium]|nr:DUF1697 domain-containing protein [Actinomycetota bacterium]